MSVDTQTEALADGIILTEVAAKKVSDLAASEGEEGLALRISVAPGGCSGLRYQLALDDRELDVMASTGTSVSHCPTTALKVSYGVTQVGKMPEMVQRGISSYSQRKPGI